MPAIILFTLAVAVIVIIMLYVHDTRRPRAKRDERAVTREPPAPPSGNNGDLLASEDLESLASHVRELRRAVDNGLIGREEAIASIVRQADGRVGERAAGQLLDSAEGD